MMRQKIVGTYHIGDVSVQVVLREGGGADTFVHPGDIPNPRIKIGADVDTWGEVLGALVHEAVEYCMARLRVRFQRADSEHWDSTSYVFIFNHEQFSDISRRVGDFEARCLPDLLKAWRKWHREGASDETT